MLGRGKSVLSILLVNMVKVSLKRKAEFFPSAFSIFWVKHLKARHNNITRGTFFWLFDVFWEICPIWVLKEVIGPLCPLNPPLFGVLVGLKTLTRMIWSV